LGLTKIGVSRVTRIKHFFFTGLMKILFMNLLMCFELLLLFSLQEISQSRILQSILTLIKLRINIKKKKINILYTVERLLNYNLKKKRILRK